MASLSSWDSFSSFKKEKIMRLTTLYPIDLSQHKLIALDFHDMFDIRMDNRFLNLTELGELFLKLVETRMYRMWTHVYLLLKLALWHCKCKNIIFDDEACQEQCL